MSKPRKPIFVILCLLACFAFPLFAANAQFVEAVITINPASGTATVSGKWTSTRRNLSFLPSAVGAPDLGGRISNVALQDAAGRPVPFRAFNSAEYVAEADFAGFSYSVDLKPLADSRSAAHASWIGRNEGLIYPEDILPRATGNRPKRAALSFVTPDGWAVINTGYIPNNGIYEIEDFERSVFVIGKDISESIVSAAETELLILRSGEWLFDDAEAASMASEVYSAYVKVFGGGPKSATSIVLLSIPQAGVQKGVWEAETRGSTVVIASSDMHFKTQSLQRLHEQLRHEIFHLWLPNGVNLTGRYDWFYEGFALYQSLRTGVALNRIRFEDFLDTLSRAHNIDRSQTHKRSLIEASRERWNGADTQVYARGMVVAFLCDLVLLQGSNRKVSVENLMAKLFSAHRHPAAAADANEAVLRLFDAEPKLASLASDYIRGAKPIDWEGIIDLAGLENEPGTSRTNLRIKPKLSGRQKTLLDKLGYNNWRKLTRK